MEVYMSKRFAVKRLDSVFGPSFCGDAYALANMGTDWSVFAAIYTVGITGYYQLLCYYL
jgi:hypothetical protein